MERKSFKFEVKSFSEDTGEFEGISAAFRKEPDAVGDIIHTGSFTKTIQENKGEIMLTYPPHDLKSIVGSGPMEETSKGLLVKGVILRGIQKGEEAYLLMKAGIIRTLSIGYDAVKWSMKDNIRHITEIKLYEVALVPGTLAADDQAVILDVKAAEYALNNNNIDSIRAALNTLQVMVESKAATGYSNQPLADRGRGWDAGAAEKRVRAWAGGDEPDWQKYRKAFFWYDSANAQEFGSYKLGFADVIDGELTAIPRGIFAAAGVMAGARGGVNIPAGDEAGVKRHIERYYAKMRDEFEDETIIAPWLKSAQGNEEENTAIGQLEALQMQVKVKQEPAPATSISVSESEAAKLKEVLSGIQSDIDGFDTQAANARLDAVIASL